MLKDYPTIAYWCGVPLSEVPRDELERAFSDAYHKLAELEHEVARRSVAHINDLARMRQVK